MSESLICPFCFNRIEVPSENTPGMGYSVIGCPDCHGEIRYRVVGCVEGDER